MLHTYAWMHPAIRKKGVLNPVLNFTDVSIRNLSTEGYHWDSKTTGLGIRVGKNRKTWVVVKGKNRTKVTLGHYPSLGLAEARRKALLEITAPRADKPSLTFPEALQLFLGQDKWRPRSKKVLESSLRHFTWKGSLDKITHEDVAQALDAIKSPSARAHALKDIRSFFNWTVPRYLPASPAAGLRMASQPKRARVLSDDELRRVWTACEGTFGTIVRLLILTGQRKSEIGGLQWEWINQGGITLPPTVTKNGREHSLPLGTFTAEILRTASSKSGIMFSATGAPSLPYNGYAFHLKMLQKASQTSDWTLHDLRRTFATNLAALGVPIHITEKLLNHVSGTTGGLVGIYNRYAYWDEQKAALEKWENKLQEIVGR